MESALQSESLFSEVTRMFQQGFITFQDGGDVASISLADLDQVHHYASAFSALQRAQGFVKQGGCGCVVLSNFPRDDCGKRRYTVFVFKV